MRKRLAKTITVRKKYLRLQMACRGLGELIDSSLATRQKSPEHKEKFFALWAQ
jgi:hypothetical protein